MHFTLIFHVQVLGCVAGRVARLALLGQILEIWSQITLAGPKIFVWLFSSFPGWMSHCLTTLVHV